MRRDGEGELHVGLAEQALQELAAGNPHRPARGRGQRDVELRETPDRRSLKDGERRHNWRDFGNHLHGRGAGADHRDALAAQILAVIPPRGVHGDAAERVHAVDVGQVRHRQHAAGADHKPRRELARRVGLHPPQVVLVVELGRLHLGVEPDSGSDAVFVGAMFGIRLELTSRCVGARPVPALLEGELVGERRNVHGDTGIGVPVPGAADPVACLDDQVIGQPGPVQVDGRTDAGESGADDQRVIVGGFFARDHRCLP